ncbi:MAG: ribosome assembly cofactor RimP [Bacteroidales bacterium]|nr:ribosome assembly cofactor RimP [Bacteroidales bacterium]MEA4840462.1 ribosome assembly cofactor RimP [Bacteroidales bacterium]
MVQKDLVIQIVEEWMENTSFFLVDVKINPENEIFIEFESESDDVNIDECVDLSKFVESRLDRDQEDFALEVGSAGLGQPFKVLKQYLIHIGDEVEIITKAGKKVSGVLKSADENGFILTENRKVKLENSKKVMKMDVDETYQHADVKSVKYLIRFS